MRSPRDFGKPLALGAPVPPLEIPVKPSRVIHFFDPSNAKMAAKLPDIAPQTDILLGNLEDAIPADRKVEAREGLVRIGREVDLGDTPLWTRVNSLDSPWFLDDVMRLVGEIGDRLEVVMIPKVEGPWDIHYVDRLLAQQDPWHYSIARMVDACAATGCLPFYGPFGDISDPLGCEDQFRAAFLLGCVGAWSLHPSQLEIAKRVFSPPVEEVKFAKRVLEAMPDGRGVLMLDGKMQDDATWKQCRVMVNLAKLLAAKDPQLARAYGL